MPRVLVINPNSNPGVTKGIAQALESLRAESSAVIDVVGLSGTPYGIESQQDVDAVAGPIAACITADGSDHDAYVIACFSDPGLYGAREVTRKSVFGIASVGLLTALAIGNTVGIISILGTSIPRHWRMYRAMGIAERIAGDLPVGASVAELADVSSMGVRMRDVGQRLVEGEGADVLVLGCAGMAHFRGPLERELGVTVVDPTQAAVGMSIASIALGYRTS